MAERAGDQEMQEYEIEGGEDMDAALQQEGCVEVKFDSDEDVPPESDEEGMDDPQDREEGVIDEREIYSDEDGEFHPEVDDAMAHIVHKESVLSCAFNPADRRLLLTGSQDDDAVLWAIEEESGGLKMTERYRLKGHTDSVSQVAFSSDGKFAATGSYDGTVGIWNPETGALVHSLDGPSKEVEWILWHPKGHAILAGSADTMAWMWWAPTGKLMQIFAGHAQSVSCGAWGLGGKLIVTASTDRSVIVWNPRAGTPQQHIREVHDAPICSMCSHSEAPLAVTGSEDGSARVVHIETGKVVANLPAHQDSVEACAFNNAGPNELSLLATASMDGKIQVWDGKTFDARCTLQEHVGEGGVVRFKWLPQSAYSAWLCTCSTDGTLRLFNALAGQCMRTLRGHTDTVLDLDVAVGEVAGVTGVPPGAALQMAVASGSDDNTCRLYTVDLWAVSGDSATAAVAAPASAPASSGAPIPPPTPASLEAGLSP